MCRKHTEMRQKLQSAAGAYKKEKATSFKVLTQKSSLEETKNNTRPYTPIMPSHKTVQELWRQKADWDGH